MFKNIVLIRNISKGAKLGKMLKSAFLMSWSELPDMEAGNVNFLKYSDRPLHNKSNLGISTDKTGKAKF